MPRPARPPLVGRTRIVGVLGGIASGKSAVARRLAGPEGVVLDADREARAVLESDAVKEELVRAFGPAVLRPDGAPDRDALAARVFASPADRARLEALTHPRIRDRIRRALDDALARGVPRVVLDVPLLVENEAQHGLLSRCHELWFVDASQETRDARARTLRGWKAGEVERRERAQVPLSEKRVLADVVISNEGTLAELESAVERALAERASRGKPGASP
ncbi:MAG: dephospho-CoA kinase [Planctomycetes bacterium]|nr:dephospho-CoA kinase [Planctomycetota bacterium]